MKAKAPPRRVELIAAQMERRRIAEIASAAPPVTPRPPPDRSRPSVSGNVAPDPLSPFAGRQRYSPQRMAAIAAAKVRKEKLQ